MREINLEELKKIELSVMKEIHKICTEQDIKYSLCGGTLLGAIRHGGFIPWDDDIDIFMPRPDYDRFVKYCQENETPFDLLSLETDERYGYLFAKAMAKNTRIIEDNSNPNGIEMGVYVDIFPIDGLGSTYEEALKEFKSSRFKREMLVAKNWKKYFRSKTRSWKYEPIRFAFFVASRFVSMKKLVGKTQSKLRLTSYDESDYVATICGSYREKEIMEKTVFEECVDIAFEDAVFKGIKEYDKYLSHIYRNYMELPPEKNRVSHHMFKAYYLND